MTLPDLDIISPEHRFTETEPIELWSAHISMRIPYFDFQDIVARTAQEDGQRYTGFITKDNEDNVTSFTRTRYPRKKYGIVSIEDCETRTTKLADRLNSVAQPDNQNTGLRVVLGLLEGYDTRSPTHTADEVQLALPTADVTFAEIFALRRDTDDGITLYTEPAAIIKAPRSLIRDVYNLADKFKQERFAVENFETGLAYMVETRHCTKPDVK